MSPTDHEVQVAVAAAIAAEAAVSPAPAPPASSLAPAALATKAELETAMGDPTGDYWRFPRNQALYADLVRAEQLGLADATGPLFEPDADLPPTVDGYNIAAADGARGMTALQRDFADSWLATAHGAGIGQRKACQAIGWVLTIPDLTEAQFRNLAVAGGWSDRAVAIALEWATRA